MPLTSICRWPPRYGVRSRTARRSLVSDSPPARDLATVLGVNTNTVLRSLRLLQEEGLLELRRRRGITVAGTPERGAVMQKVRELVEFARGQGYAVDELVEMIEDVA
jgi:DNA-binding transcriptional regulator YhcF (GntR family)